MDQATLDKRYKINDNIIFKDTGEEQVFLIFIDQDNYYFKIDGLAANVWRVFMTQDERFQVPSQVYQECLKRYDPPVEQFKNDFDNYIGQLIEENILILDS